MRNVILFTATLFLSSGVYAQGVKAKKAWSEVETKMNEGATKVKGKCGTEVKIEFDKSSFGSDEVSKAFWCMSALEAISTLCSDVDYKDAISKSIKTVQCKYDASVTAGSPGYGNKFELKNGTFTHFYHKGSANLESRATDWMKENL